jgi:hypothetical protein
MSVVITTRDRMKGLKPRDGPKECIEHTASPTIPIAYPAARPVIPHAARQFMRQAELIRERHHWAR